MAPVRHSCGCRHDGAGPHRGRRQRGGEKVVDDRSKDGVFAFRNPKINADLSLVYEKVKILRGMEGYGWFANTWVDQTSGKLEVKDVKIHKVPVQEDGVWTQVPRYTFDNETFDVIN